MNRIYIIFLIFSAVMISACDNNRDSRGGNGDFYFDYSITGEEGNDNLTVLLLYRDGGKEEDAIHTGPSSQVSLDGQPILPDSTGIGGIFYETHKPLTEFTGEHEILFKDANGKDYREAFNFQPFVLVSVIPDTLQRGDLVFKFSGLEPDDRVRVLLTDTSFINDGVNRVEKVGEGELVIAAASLDRVANGPVQLEFIREFERPVKNGSGQGGKFRMTYSLKREFILKD